MNQGQGRVCLFAAAVLSFATAGWATEIPASNFFKNSQKVIQVKGGPDDVVVFDALENDLYVLDGRDLSIVADKIKLNGEVVVTSYRTAAAVGTGSGSPGSTGQSFGAAGDCGNGRRGGDGGAGGEGVAGSEGRRGTIVKLDIGSIVGPGTIKFLTVGQNGGSGGVGGRGGDGGRGETGGNGKSGLFGCDCGGGNAGPGGNGGVGGVGGRGGDGGDGGAIVMSPRTAQVRPRLAFSVTGGRGATGGPGGPSGGAGGPGGAGGGNGFCGGGHGSAAGAPGPAGSEGSRGRDGKEGTIVEF